MSPKWAKIGPAKSRFKKEKSKIEVKMEKLGEKCNKSNKIGDKGRIFALGIFEGGEHADCWVQVACPYC